MNAAASTPRPDAEHPTGGTTPPTIVEPLTTAQLVARAVGSWRAALAARAGGSSLADVGLLGDAVLDLSAAHPSGVAQLFAGRPTQLANLFREGSSLPTARRRARAVGIRAKEHAERFGIAPTYLAIGIATWTEDAVTSEGSGDLAALARVTGAAPSDQTPDDDAPSTRERRTVRAPVLLRPIRLQPRGSGESDYELTLETTAELNPVLSRALRSRGALLDPVALANSAFESGGFDPRAVTERVHALGTAVLADFELVEKLVVGTFVHPGQALVDDLDELAGLEHNELVSALATPDATEPVSELPPLRLGDEDPSDERGVGDLDPSARHLLDAVASGAHVFVDAPAGSDVAGTVSALIADAAASGRTVLYVPGHRRAAEQVITRMDELGMGELLLDIAPEPTWRASVSGRLLAAMTLEAPHVDRARIGRVRADLIDTRRRLAGYIDALHLVRDPWGVSAYDALQALARLTAERPSPATEVRLPAQVTARLDAAARSEAADCMTRAGALGAFSLRATATPWFNAGLLTAEAARDAHTRTERLSGELLPRLREQVQRVCADTGLTEPANLSTWGKELQMLAGMRGTLDVFQPMIFERTAADLVAATGTRQFRALHAPTMGRMQRRRLAKQAKDMLRPGSRVPDLHAALVEVQAQRQVWTQHCPGGGWPRLPEGLAAIEATFADVVANLDALAPVLATTPDGAGLLDANLDDLQSRLERLADDREALDTLPERTALLADLRTQGLAELLDDLAHRRVDTGLVAAELDLAWWSSVFEQILGQDPALATYDGAGLEALAARFRELDTEHVRSLGVPALASAIGYLTRAMRAYPDDTETLFATLIEGHFTSLRETIEKFPAIARRLRPAVIATPTLVPHLLPASRTVDVVVLDSVQHLSLDVLVPAIARGRQVVVIGDARCASGDAVRELSRVLPTVALRAQVSSRDQQFVDFLVRHGYQDVLRPTPLPRSRELIGFETVHGTGMPDQTTGTVLTTHAEVERVVDLAIHHALTRPEESLAIIALSGVHADRIREALLSEVRHNPALARFFDPTRHEPVVIADLGAVAGLSREAVILALGFGRTPHGRVLHRFGVVGEESGQALLLDALGVSRARLTVVSCFTAEDLDPERLRAPGPQLLADLLEFAERRAAEGPVGQYEGIETDLNPDRLVIDLAERLWAAGLLVETDYGITGGDRIPLVVGHPDLPDRMLVAVLTDDDAYIAERSVRVRDRQHAERLESLGWTVVQVWSAAAFLDPVKEANRVRQVVLELAERIRAEERTAPAVVPFDAMEDSGEQPVVGADGLPRYASPVVAAVDAEVAVTRPTRPAIEPGLPISAYGDNELDELAAWIRSDGVERDAEQLAGALRAELGVVRRSTRVDTAVRAAVRRVLAL